MSSHPSIQSPGDLPAGLAQPALRALSEAGIHNLADLSKFSEDEIRLLHGIGPNALARLGKALALNNLAYHAASKINPSGSTKLKTEPTIETREAHPYAAVRLQVPIPFDKYLGPAWARVNTRLAVEGLAHGPAIIRYLTTDMSTNLDIEVGYVIDRTIPAGDGITSGVLPAGKYACLTHIGSYRGKGVYKANVVMMEWAERNKVPWMIEEKAGVNWWDTRVEWYFNDPATDPDPQKYKTELTFRVVDEQ